MPPGDEILENSIYRGDGEFGIATIIVTNETWRRQVREGNLRMVYCVPHYPIPFGGGNPRILNEDFKYFSMLTEGKKGVIIFMPIFLLNGPLC